MDTATAWLRKRKYFQILPHHRRTAGRERDIFRVRLPDVLIAHHEILTLKKPALNLIICLKTTFRHKCHKPPILSAFDFRNFLR
jgi:hypothetical protein